MSHGLVEPLQEDDERIVGLFFACARTCPGNTRAVSATSPLPIAVLRLTTVWSVIDASSTTVSLRIRFPASVGAGLPAIAARKGARRRRGQRWLPTMLRHSTRWAQGDPTVFVSDVSSAVAVT